MPEPRELDPRLFRASALVRAARAPSTHTDDGTAPPRSPTWLPAGRLVELTGGLDGAPTSVAVALVADAQRTGSIVAWLQPERGRLFPPDLAANGVDLDALVVVHVPQSPDALPTPPPGRRRTRSRTAAGEHDLPKAAEWLLRSGAFDLVVIDLRPRPPRPGAWLGRLQALARMHRTTVLLLSEATAPLEHGSTATLRLMPRRRRDRAAFVVETEVVRDKLHAATAPAATVRSGPTGLC